MTLDLQGFPLNPIRVNCIEVSICYANFVKVTSALRKAKCFFLPYVMNVCMLKIFFLYLFLTNLKDKCFLEKLIDAQLVNNSTRFI